MDRLCILLVVRQVVVCELNCNLVYMDELQVNMPVNYSVKKLNKKINKKLN